MNHAEAYERAKRIKRSWFGGPPVDEWTGYLAGFDDVERADRVTHDWRGKVEHATFKRFGDDYRSLAHIERAREQPAPESPWPRITREQRYAILRQAGCRQRYTGGDE